MNIVDKAPIFLFVSAAVFVVLGNDVHALVDFLNIYMHQISLSLLIPLLLLFALLILAVFELL